MKVDSVTKLAVHHLDHSLSFFLLLFLTKILLFKVADDSFHDRLLTALEDTHPHWVI